MHGHLTISTELRLLFGRMTMGAPEIFNLIIDYIFNSPIIYDIVLFLFCFHSMFTFNCANLPCTFGGIVFLELRLLVVVLLLFCMQFGESFAQFFCCPNFIEFGLPFFDHVAFELIFEFFHSECCIWWLQNVIQIGHQFIAICVWGWEKNRNILNWNITTYNSINELNTRTSRKRTKERWRQKKTSTKCLLNYFTSFDG